MSKCISLAEFVVNADSIEDYELIRDLFKAKKTIALSSNHTYLKPYELEKIIFHIVKFNHKFANYNFYRIAFRMYNTMHYLYYLAHNIDALKQKLGDDR